MSIDWNTVIAAVWRRNAGQLKAISEIDPVTPDMLTGIERQKAELLQNTQRFLQMQPANNALLWGARGTGKSSLIKAVLNRYHADGLRLIEIYKNDLHNLPDIVDEIRSEPFRFIIYCDDFSFDTNDDSYIGLKTLLDGSIEKAPDNTLLYATSNRRHLLPETMQDNLQIEMGGDELHYSDAVEEKIALSDRFGLWLSFYSFTQQQYFDIVDSYFSEYSGDRDILHREAEKFARQRGSKSGRTARQFYNAYSQHETG